MNEILPMLAGYKAGFGKGARQIWSRKKSKEFQEIETKWTLEVGRIAGAFERSPYKILRKAAPLITPPTRFLRFMDAWTGQMGYEAHARSMARRAANEKGLTGETQKAFEKEYLETRQAEYHEPSMAQAQYSNFTDKPDPWTQKIVDIRNVPVLGPAMRLTILPFVNTISNLAKRGVEMTPGVGIGKEAISRGMGRGQYTPEVIAKQIEGLTISSYIISKIVDGEITGPMPQGKAERESWYRQKKKPWAIKYGDTWYEFRRMEPFNTVISMTHTAYKAIEKAMTDPDKNIDQATQIMTDLALGIKENLIDGSYFQGMQALFDRHDKRRGAVPKWTASWVPYSSFWRSMNRAYEVATEGEAKPREGNEWVKAFSQVIPGLPKGPTKLDVWGNESVIPGGVLRQWLPYKWAKETDDPLEKELARLNIYPARPPETLIYRNEKFDIPQKLYRKYAVATGAEAYQKLSAKIKEEDYKAKSDEKKIKTLQKRFDRARRKHRKKLISEMRRLQIIKGL